MEIESDTEEVYSAHSAAASGDVSLLDKAIQKDPTSLEQEDGEGFTPIIHAVRSKQKETFKRLIKMGANINAQDKNGRSCVSIAAYQGWYEGLVYLLKKGAKQNIADKSGRTALHASTYCRDVKIISTLLHHLPREEVNKPDNEKMTSLHWAAFHDRPEHVQILVLHHANIHCQDMDGKTALHWAAQKGSLESCKVLLHCEYSPQIVNQMDNSGKTAIHYASAAGHVGILEELSRVEECELECEDQDDRTPLHWAAAMGHSSCVNLLLKLNVTPNPADLEGGTPYDYAQQADHKDCINSLKKYLSMKNLPYQENKNQKPWKLHTNESKSSRQIRNPLGKLKNLFRPKRNKTSGTPTSESGTNNSDSIEMKTISSDKPRGKSAKQRKNSIELRTGIRGRERTNSTISHGTSHSTISSMFTVNSASNVMLNISADDTESVPPTPSTPVTPTQPPASKPIPVPILTVCLPDNTEQLRLQSRMNYQTHHTEDYSSDEKEFADFDDSHLHLRPSSKRSNNNDKERILHEPHKINRPLSNRSVLSSRSNIKTPVMSSYNLNIETSAIVHHRRDSMSDSDNPISPRSRIVPKITFSAVSDESDNGVSSKQNSKKKSKKKAKQTQTHSMKFISPEHSYTTMQAIGSRVSPTPTLPPVMTPRLSPIATTKFLPKEPLGKKKAEDLAPLRLPTTPNTGIIPGIGRAEKGQRKRTPTPPSIKLWLSEDQHYSRITPVPSPVPPENEPRRHPGLIHRISGLSGISTDSNQFLFVENDNAPRFSPVHFDNDMRRPLTKRLSGLSDASQFLNVDSNDTLLSKNSPVPSPLHFDFELGDKIRSRAPSLSRRISGLSESSQYLNVDCNESLRSKLSPNPSPLHFDLEHDKSRKPHTLVRRISGGLEPQPYFHVDSDNTQRVSPNPSPIPHVHELDDKFRKGHSLVRKLSGFSEAQGLLPVKDLSPTTARVPQHSGLRNTVGSPRSDGIQIQPLNASFSSSTGKFMPSSPTHLSPGEKKTLDRTIHSLLH